MSTTNPSTPAAMNTTVQEIKDHLAQWESGINRLEDEVQNIRQESQKEYHDQLAVLRQHLRELRIRLQALHEGELQEWRESRPAFYERLNRFRNVFMQTAQKLHREDQAVLGWLQGFTEERSQESAGWTEGMGEQPEGSAGWTEGLGHRPAGSEGWTEGYEKVNKD